MKNSDWKDRLNVVYSTNPDYNYEMDDDEEQVTLEPSQQNLRVQLDRKNRGGKVVTLITGFVGTENDLKVYLTWDTDRSDVDLWVTSPSGERIFYSHRLGKNGEAIHTLEQEGVAAAARERAMLARLLAGLAASGYTSALDPLKDGSVDGKPVTGIPE